mgnify:CR=1 FL=1
MKDVQICEYDLTKDGKKQGKVAILRGGLHSENPIAHMNSAVSEYVERELFNEFVEIHMDNPWVRVIVSNINELDYKPFENQRLNG